jgi:electron transport complex protein RnfG
MREIGRLALVLVVICMVAAGGLAAIREGLASRIEQQEDYYVRGPALERLSGRDATELLANKVHVDIDGADYPVFYLREEGEISFLAIEATGTGGYGGDIQVMIGIDLASETMLGLEIIAHSETPGLGAQVEKPGFRAQWQGLSATQEVGLGADVDAISGATYSSRAVVAGTNRIVDLLRDRREELLEAIATAAGGGQEDVS